MIQRTITELVEPAASMIVIEVIKKGRETRFFGSKVGSGQCVAMRSCHKPEFRCPAHTSKLSIVEWTCDPRAGWTSR